MSAGQTRLILIACALVLAVLLFIAPKNAPVQETVGEKRASMPAGTSATLDVFLRMARKGLEPNKKTRLEKLESLQLYDSISNFWTAARRPDLAAFYKEQL